MSTNYYDVLGIDQKASTTLDIRKAYKNLALKFHPDKNNITGAEEKFKLILEAHNILIDPVKRAEFDLKLNSKKFKCIYCYASYVNSEELFEHVSDLHKCSTCFLEFPDLIQHKKKCQPLQFQCCFCYASFANYKLLFNHFTSFHSNLCECIECNACFETEEELDQHVWQIHLFKNVKYVFVGVFWGFLVCVSGGILDGALGGILGGAFGGIFGADFFATEEGLNQHQRMFIPMHSTGTEWKPKKAKKERKKRNKKRRK